MGTGMSGKQYTECGSKSEPLTLENLNKIIWDYKFQLLIDVDREIHMRKIVAEEIDYAFRIRDLSRNVMRDYERLTGNRFTKGK